MMKISLKCHVGHSHHVDEWNDTCFNIESYGLHVMCKVYIVPEFQARPALGMMKELNKAMQDPEYDSYKAKIHTSSPHSNEVGDFAVERTSPQSARADDTSSKHESSLGLGGSYGLALACLTSCGTLVRLFACVIEIFSVTTYHNAAARATIHTVYVGCTKPCSPWRFWGWVFYARKVVTFLLVGGFGPGRLWILYVRGVPGFSEWPAQLLPLSRQLPLQPQDVLHS